MPPLPRVLARVDSASLSGLSVRTGALSDSPGRDSPVDFLVMCAKLPPARHFASFYPEVGGGPPDGGLVAARRISLALAAMVGALTFVL